MKNGLVDFFDHKDAKAYLCELRVSVVYFFTTKTIKILHKDHRNFIQRTYAV